MFPPHVSKSIHPCKSVLFFIHPFTYTLLLRGLLLELAGGGDVTLVAADSQTSTLLDCHL